MNNYPRDGKDSIGDEMPDYTDNDPMKASVESGDSGSDEVEEQLSIYQKGAASLFAKGATSIFISNDAGTEFTCSLPSSEDPKPVKDELARLGFDFIVAPRESALRREFATFIRITDPNFAPYVEAAKAFHNSRSDNDRPAKSEF